MSVASILQGQLTSEIMLMVCDRYGWPQARVAAVAEELASARIFALPEAERVAVIRAAINKEAERCPMAGDK